ncbi:protein ILRUN isoform X2 [Toxorhynchites rutilus septentrionalis]|uniref:protein ILRUN isoform X2 n=1 Tax=Toxorhynchites rutilus septentrionalis TaxID=329112 RepID=UPI002479FCAA|nr:protein ILRUN isoform X2 [Toxorhynchites rutilus septentrionalis]
MEDNQSMDDIEQNFLTQFSSMVTTDKEDLIKQFQTIGENLNYSTATFFLDMSNWNLQTAVGCYFDFMAFSRVPSMKVLNDLTIGKDEKVTPNTPFQLCWLLQNNGESSWPDGVYMKNEEDSRKYFMPALSPNDTATLTVDLVSPATLGSFVSRWFLRTANGTVFGEPISSTIEVCESGTLAITQRLAQLQTVSSSDVEIVDSQPEIEQNAQSGTLEDTEMWG